MDDKVSQIDSMVKNLTEGFNGLLCHLADVDNEISHERRARSLVAEHEEAEGWYPSGYYDGVG